MLLYFSPTFGVRTVYGHGSVTFERKHRLKSMFDSGSQSLRVSYCFLLYLPL